MTAKLFDFDYVPLWHCKHLGYEHVREEVDKGLISERIDELLGTLTAREAQVLRLRFWNRLTLEEIGQIMGVSSPRVGQLERKALLKLRNPTRKEFYNEIFQVPKGFYPREFDGANWATELEYGVSIAKEEVRQYHEDEVEKKAKREADELKWAAEQAERRAKIQREIDEYRANILKRPYEFVELKFKGNEPYLWISPLRGSICRDNDPEVYDSWLKILLERAG